MTSQATDDPYQAGFVLRPQFLESLVWVRRLTGRRRINVLHSVGPRKEVASSDVFEVMADGVHGTKCTSLNIYFRRCSSGLYHRLTHVFFTFTRSLLESNNAVLKSFTQRPINEVSLQKTYELRD